MTPDTPMDCPKPDYKNMNCGDFLAAVGTDARKWADAFEQIRPPTDHATMLGWFANAIENTRIQDSGPAQPAGVRVGVIREAFEKWYDSTASEMVRHGDGYYSIETENAWQVWQAAHNILPTQTADVGSSPLIRRYTDEQGNKMVALAEWFYEEMCKCMPDENTPSPAPVDQQRAEEYKSDEMRCFEYLYEKYLKEHAEKNYATMQFCKEIFSALRREHKSPVPAGVVEALEAADAHYKQLGFDKNNTENHGNKIYLKNAKALNLVNRHSKEKS